MAAEGQALLERALKTLDDTVTEKDRRLADALSAWGFIDWSRGDIPAAADKFGEALKVRQRSLGEQHWQTGESYYDVATAVHAQGRLDEARPFYETALAIYEVWSVKTISAPSSPSVVMTPMSFRTPGPPPDPP